MKKRKRPVVKRIPGLASRRKTEPNPADPDYSAYFCGSARIQTKNCRNAERASLRRQIRFGLLKIIPNKKRR